MNNKYYIEFGPQYTRSFINKPPERPLGKIIEITEDEWNDLKKSHPSTWNLDNKIIIISEKKSMLKHKFNYKLIITLLIGIIVGFFLY